MQFLVQKLYWRITNTIVKMARWNRTRDEVNEPRFDGWVVESIKKAAVMEMAKILSRLFALMDPSGRWNNGPPFFFGKTMKQLSSKEFWATEIMTAQKYAETFDKGKLPDTSPPRSPSSMLMIEYRHGCRGGKQSSGHLSLIHI